MSPKESPKKISLIQFLDQFAYKEEVQDILNSFDLPVSGTKDELLQRLKRPLSSEDPTNILNKLSKDSLKNACDYYGLPVGGTKDALIERILNDIITGKSLAVEKSDIKSEIIADIPTKNSAKKDQLYEILNGLSKSDIERGLKDEGLSTSGSKEEMIVRLLAATKNDPKRTLMSLDGQKLNAYAEENDIPRRRSKEDQVNEILKMEFGMDALTINDNSKVTKEVRAVESVKSPQVVPSVVSTQKDADFINVIEAIKGWIPQIGHPTEDGYRTALSAELQFRHHFPVELEAGATKADILVMKKIPIEMKKSPNKSEYDRCFGQVFENLDAYGYVIVVICALKQLDDFNNFKDKVARHVGSRMAQVEIIRKN